MTKTALELSIEEIENELAKETGIEKEAVEEVKTEEEHQEPVKEEVKEETKEESKKEEPVVDNATIARLRFEAAEARRRAQALEKENEELKTPKVELPAKEENWEGHTEGRIETVEQRLARLEEELEQERTEKQTKSTIEAAKEEFNAYEDAFKPKAPDYEDARTYLVQNIAASLRILNPAITQKELIDGVQHQLLVRGRNAVLAGANPAELIYQEAKQIGFSAPAKVETKEKPSNLAAVNENKKRSAGMAGSSAGGESTLSSPESVLKMSNAEISRMSESDWAALEAEARRR
jgi:hypothetical protein